MFQDVDFLEKNRNFMYHFFGTPGSTQGYSTRNHETWISQDGKRYHDLVGYTMIKALVGKKQHKF